MYPRNVIVVGAGPVGCIAALLLADRGIPVTVLERHPLPHPLPRAVHLDDEVTRILQRIGVGDAFLAGSRPACGLRLLDARHRVMAEFRRQPEVPDSGFPGANMFHQPELEALLFHRVDRHPLIDLRRGVEVRALDGVHDPLSGPPVHVHTRAVAGEAAQTFTGGLVLGCDGANSTVRQLLGVHVQDLGFTERWLVVDVRAAAPLNSWAGVEQVCDPARAATFMQVTGDRYRWEFQLRDGEDETDLIAQLGSLLQPWSGRPDLAGLEVTRKAVYTFRAGLATHFQIGRAFLLGDAAHLTPPFIGQGLAAGLRDADNVAWKIAYVLTGRATPDLLATYQTERRPHAAAMIRKAKLFGWAMTGGQNAAAVRRFLLGVAVRSARVRDAVASTATPRLRGGALRQTSALSRPPRALRVGALIPNPPLCLISGEQVRLDDLLDGAPAMVTARRPEPRLVDVCRRRDITLVRVTDGTDAEPNGGWVDVRLASGRTTGLHALVDDPSLTVLVRPDRYIAAVGTRSQPPHLTWTTTDRRS
ncbi:bifunctional 3-(3-hydroxy-phenyl)propionate/3-hydroxycinnamic acid hydroxylase [Streptosporangiaceae bacterium NEAU-GS5]|nr:bifunctional 3-(3-hydroxy-phenyl)propionate/3-hydroxycinnamic acid hydroxylase [Streptosporangiaceae bacterium NEAU-GS5]